MENHYFNINIATKYGVNCAIILQNILYWIEHNKENNKNLYDGQYWTYNPVKEFKAQFPYLTERQIRTALDILKDEGLVLTANYNKGCDRTLWYTVTQKALDIINNNQDKQEIQEDFSYPDKESIIEKDLNLCESVSEEQKSQMEMTSESNRNDIQVNTICHTSQYEMTPVSNRTNNKPQIINTDKLEKEIYKEKEPPEQVIFNFWNSKNLLKAEEFSNYIKAVISTALKSFTLEQLEIAIERYDLVYNSKHFFNHGWKLESFLSGKAIRNFLDNGEHWINYCNWKNNQQSKNGFIHNSYSQEQINSLITNLDTWEV